MKQSNLALSHCNPDLEQSSLDMSCCKIALCRNNPAPHHSSLGTQQTNLGMKRSNLGMERSNPALRRNWLVTCRRRLSRGRRESWPGCEGGATLASGPAGLAASLQVLDQLEILFARFDLHRLLVANDFGLIPHVDHRVRALGFRDANDFINRLIILFGG